MTTLDNLPSGSIARVVKIIDTCRGFINRLYQLGILPGVIVEVVANYGCGPIVVKIHGSETAIGRGIARRIIVERLE